MAVKKRQKISCITRRELLDYRALLHSNIEKTADLILKAENEHLDALVKMYQWYKLISEIHLSFANRLIYQCKER